MTLRMNVWVMIKIGRRAVMLLALIIELLRRVVMHNSNGRGVMVRAVMTEMGRANGLVGFVMVGRAIVLWR
jgi:hypothetical protein